MANWNSMGPPGNWDESDALSNFIYLEDFVDGIAKDYEMMAHHSRCHKPTIAEKRHYDADYQPENWEHSDEAVMISCKQSADYQHCRVHGHDMIDDGSYAGPDSGAECLVCTRCGYSWSHTYY